MKNSSVFTRKNVEFIQGDENRQKIRLFLLKNVAHQNYLFKNFYLGLKFCLIEGYSSWKKLSHIHIKIP